MSKIAERHFLDGKNLIIQETHDYNPTLDQASLLRSNGGADQGSNKLVALIPVHLAFQWAREAGVSCDDPAFADVIAKNMADPDFSLFRVWGGKL